MGTVLLLDDDRVSWRVEESAKEQDLEQARRTFPILEEEAARLRDVLARLVRRPPP
jgi:hypothetical protein